MPKSLSSSSRHHRTSKSPSGKQQHMTAPAFEEPNLEGDYLNVLLLLFLYFLQGLPMGLSYTLDLILQERGLSYEEQGVYSAVSWPYSLKMLWAPLVDSIFFTSVGRRKTWLIPTQLLIAALLWHASEAVPLALEASKPSIAPLTLLFFTFYLLAATQDIAVDGWALELLQKRNLGWASTCNAIGLTAGYTLSSTGYLVLKSADLTDLPSFMRASSLAFAFATLLLWAFKAEKPSSQQVNDMSIADSYRSLVRVLRLDSVQQLVLVLLTRGVATSAGETLTTRKLIGMGMRKEQLAGVATILAPLQFVLPGLISPLTARRPLALFARAYLPKTLLVASGALLVFMAPPDLSDPPMWMLATILGLIAVLSVLSTVQFVSLMAFFAKVSDPSVGGSYMTTLNTATNLGSKWPSTAVLFLVEPLSRLIPIVDGYYVLIVASLVAGVYWLIVFDQRLVALEKLPEKRWRIQ